MQRLIDPLATDLLTGSTPFFLPPQRLDVNIYEDGRYLTSGFENVVNSHQFSRIYENDNEYQTYILATASGHLGVEPPDHEAVRVACLPNAASRIMATSFDRFVDITDLRLAKFSFACELTTSLLKMPNLRRLVITTEFDDAKLQVRQCMLPLPLPRNISSLIRLIETRNTSFPRSRQ